MANTGQDLFNQLGIDTRGKAPVEVWRELRDSHPEIFHKLEQVATKTLDQYLSDRDLVEHMTDSVAKDRARIKQKAERDRYDAKYGDSFPARMMTGLAATPFGRIHDSELDAINEPLASEQRKRRSEYEKKAKGADRDTWVRATKENTRLDRIDERGIQLVARMMKNPSQSFGITIDQPEEFNWLSREARQNPLIYVTEALRNNYGTVDAKLLRQAISAIDSKKALAEAGDILGTDPKLIIKELQKELNRRGLYNYNIDGIGGWRTKEAMLSLLPPGEDMGPEPAGYKKYLDKPQPRGKSPKEHVAEIQAKLQEMGVYAGGITGTMDEETRDGIKELQDLLKRNGLYDGKIDGIYGKKTIKGVKELEKLGYDLAANGYSGVEDFMSSPYYVDYAIKAPDVTDYSDFRM